MAEWNPEPFSGAARELTDEERVGAWESIGNELVKSYGFGIQSDGKWGWSLEQVGKSFKEDPFWTSLDYILLAAAPIRLLTGAAKVAKGSGAVAKAYRAGDYAGKAAETKLGKLGAMLTGKDDLMYAAELANKGPAKGVQVPFTGSAVGRTARFTGELTQSPASYELTPEFLAAGDKYGFEPWERRAISKSLANEQKITEGMYRRKAQDAAGMWDKAKGGVKAERFAFAALSKSRMTPDSEAVKAAFRNDQIGQKAYENTWTLRNEIHSAAYEYGLISKETYAAGLKSYNPRLYLEYEKINKLQGDLAIEKAADIGGPGGVGPGSRFRKRGAGNDSLTQVLDPRVTLNELAKAGATVSRVKFARELGESALVRPADEVADLGNRILGNPKLGEAYGLTPERISKVESLLQNRKATGNPMIAQEVAHALGWRRLGDMNLKGELPSWFIEHSDSVGKNMDDMWLDPVAVDDIVGMADFLNDDSVFGKAYKGILANFRFAKTVANPATQVRNGLGMMVSRHFAAGTQSLPTTGLKSFRAGDEDYLDMLALGGVGSSFSDETLNLMENSIKAQQGATKGASKSTVLDWLGDSTFAKYAQRGADKASDLYRAMDEVGKLDAYILQKEKYLKGGMDADGAKLLAFKDVNKFMPNFMSHSPVSAALSKTIPFSGFTSEALRTWKNVLVEKPHYAFFWNHIAETLTSVSGAASGFSPAEIEEAKSQLPDYAQGKKLLMIPFNVDGQPSFIDIGNVIPLGNLADAENSKGLYLGSLFDFSSNPLIGAAAAAATGVDPFTQQPLAPNFTERQLGVAVDQPNARRAVGLVEYMAATMLPPLVPPGYAGVNLLEAARGQMNPRTGQPLEDGVAKTIAANVFGIRSYQASASQDIKNAEGETRETRERVTNSWNRWKFAMANGDITGMKQEKERLIAIKMANGASVAEAEKYFSKQSELALPHGRMSIKEISKRLKELEGAEGEPDKRTRAELIARLQAKKGPAA